VKLNKLGISFGVSLEPTWPIDSNIELSLLSEKLGYTTVWVPDGGPATPYSDSIVTLAAIASRTRKIRFGSAVVNFYTRNPSWLASGFLALSDINARPRRARSRAILGIGLGAAYNVAKFGIISRKDMINDLREAIESIRQLWQGKDVRVRTNAFVIEQVKLSRSKRKIPIHIGSNSPKGLKLAGEIADGVILTERIASDIQESMDHVTLGLGLSSRKRSELEVTNSVVISIDDERSRARRLAKTTCAYLVAWMGDGKAEKYGLDLGKKKKISELIEKNYEKEAAKIVDDRMLDLLTVSGTPDDCVEGARAHVEQGIDQIAFCEPFGRDRRRAIETIAKKIVPKL
jgi:5,10-methylenetetrahydromethanopterin reductase